jgi:chemotaxis protein histidine kinase CheA
MTVDAFADRLARVRDRFTATLAGKISDAVASMVRLAEAAPEAAAAVAEAYRRMHGIVGVGPSVGFAATGRAAREVENVLRGPQHDRRGLTADELLQLQERLDALRDAAERELQSVPLD